MFSELMVAAGGLSNLPSAPCLQQAEGGVTSTLERKETVSSTVREQRLQGAARDKFSGGFPRKGQHCLQEPAQCGSLSPGLCWLLVKKSHSPPTAPSKPSQSPALLLGHKEKVSDRRQPSAKL